MSLDQCLTESYTSTLWKTLFKTTTSLLLTDHVNSRGGLALPNVKGVSWSDWPTAYIGIYKINNYWLKISWKKF
jgi:hypothetical protein